MEKKHISIIDIYTDGSLKRTRGGVICGYGIYFPNGELKNVAGPFNEGKLTNNRAELHAISQAILRVIKYYTFDVINIYTDSEYSQKKFNDLDKKLEEK
jgi:ribonuclease HI